MMRRNWYWIGLLFGLACGSEEIGSTAQPIVAADGEDVGPDPRFPYVVAVRNPGLCTGTLISPSHVLTAAHCVHTRRSTGPDGLAQRRTVTFGGELEGTTIEVASCFMMNDYTVASRADIIPALLGHGRPASVAEARALGDRCGVLSEGPDFPTAEQVGADLAVLQLARPVPPANRPAAIVHAPDVRVDPIAVLETSAEIPAGAGFVAVGYGSIFRPDTGSAVGTGVRRFRFLDAFRASAAIFGSRESIVSSGDSGGPLLVVAGDTAWVGAVTSTGGTSSRWAVPAGIVLDSGERAIQWIRDRVDSDGDGRPELFCPGGQRREYELGLTAAEDGDGDGHRDGADTCPGIYNPCQLGTDTDGDGLDDDCDACPLDPSIDVAIGAAEPDEDGDGYPAQCDCNEDLDATADDLLEDDRDGDLVFDSCDVCPERFNPDQSDFDMDELGDVCDPCPLDERLSSVADADRDGVPDQCDNCPVFNPSQANCNLDAEIQAGVAIYNPTLDVATGGDGDACDPVPCGETLLGTSRDGGLVDGLPTEVVATRNVIVDGRAADGAPPSMPTRARIGFRFCRCDLAGGTSRPDSPLIRLFCQETLAGGCDINDKRGYEETLEVGSAELSTWRNTTIDDPSTEAVEAVNAEIDLDYSLDPANPDFMASYRGAWRVEDDFDRWSVSFGDVLPGDSAFASIPGVLWTYTPGLADLSTPDGTPHRFADEVSDLSHHYWSGEVSRRKAPPDRPGCLRYVGPLVPGQGCPLCEASFPIPFVSSPFVDVLCRGVPEPPLLALPDLEIDPRDQLAFDLGPLVAAAGPGARWVAASEPLGSDFPNPVGPELALVGASDQLVGLVRRGDNGLFVDTVGNPPPSPCEFGQCDSLPQLGRLGGPATGDEHGAATVLSATRDRLWVLEGDAETRAGRVRVAALDRGLTRVERMPLGRVLAATYDAVRDVLYVLDEVRRGRRHRRVARLLRLPASVDGSLEELRRWPRLRWTSRFALAPDHDGSLWLAASSRFGHVVLRLGPRSSPQGRERWQASGFAAGWHTLTGAPIRVSERGLSYVTEDRWGRQRVVGLERSRTRTPPGHRELVRCF